MKNSLIHKIFLNKRFKFLEYKKKLYNNNCDKSSIEIYQLAVFNNLWKNTLSTNLFYKEWQKKYKLPKKLNDIHQLKEFPKLNKKVIQENYDLIIGSNNASQTISTGGSTGVPTIFPSSNENLLDFYSNNYLGKSWWDITPGAKTILFWGHSHLLGTGMVGKKNNILRIIKDKIVNIKRLNAYNMTSIKIKEYYLKTKKYNPQIIIGYTSCIFRLADYMIENNLENSIKGNLKLIILTAETATDIDIKRIRLAFNCNIAIEYGMAETGVIAHSMHQTDNLQVFWDSFYFHVDKTLIVTTLKRDQFPLINYDTEDIVVVNEKNTYTFKSIEGRSSDIFYLKKLEDNIHYAISGIFFVHVLKNFKGISSVQIKQVKESQVEIILVSRKKISENTVLDYFLNVSKNDFPNIDPKSIRITFSKEPKLSKSGKILINAGQKRI